MTVSPITRRRRVLQALATLPVVAVAHTANAATTDLVLNCDTTLAPAMTAAARRFAQLSAVRVRVFPTGPGLILPQLARGIQNDLICTQPATIAAAAQDNLVTAGASQGAWRNRLVIACRHGSGTASLKGRLAVSDPTPASDMDGPALVRALSLQPATITGVIDTDEVAWLLLRGEADAGLLHLTDVRANPGLEIVLSVPEAAAPPITYAITVTKLARRPNPQAFVTFIASPEGSALLNAHGLESIS
jgi:molybdate transport system substrate-binding protein